MRRVSETSEAEAARQKEVLKTYWKNLGKSRARIAASTEQAPVQALEERLQMITAPMASPTVKVEGQNPAAPTATAPARNDLDPALREAVLEHNKHVISPARVQTLTFTEKPGKDSRGSQGETGHDRASLSREFEQAVAEHNAGVAAKDAERNGAPVVVKTEQVTEEKQSDPYAQAFSAAVDAHNKGVVGPQSDVVLQAS